MSITNYKSIDCRVATAFLDHFTSRLAPCKHAQRTDY